MAAAERWVSSSVLAVAVALTASCAGGRMEQRALEADDDEGYVVAEGRWRVGAAVKRAVERERLDNPLHEVHLDDVEGAPRVQVPSVRAPVVHPSPGEGISYFEVAIDRQLSAECVVRSGRLDLAQAFHRAHRELSSRPALERRHLPAPTIHEGPGGPVLMMRLEYLTPERAYGTLRMAATNVKDRGLFCTMDSPGYARSFERLVDAVAEGLHAANEDVARRRSFHVITVNGAVAGLSEDITKEREDGSLVDMSFVALLTPAGSELRAVDEVSVEITATGGELVTLRVMQQVDGAMTRDVSINPGRHATLEDRLGEARTDLGAMAPVTGRLLRRHYASELERGGGPPRVFLRYYPGLDVGGLAEETVQLAEVQGGQGVFTSVIRTPREVIESRYEVGEDGERRRGVITRGAATLTLERLPPRR